MSLYHQKSFSLESHHRLSCQHVAYELSDWKNDFMPSQGSYQCISAGHVCIYRGLIGKSPAYTSVSLEASLCAVPSRMVGLLVSTNAAGLVFVYESFLSTVFGIIDTTLRLLLSLLVLDIWPNVMITLAILVTASSALCTGTE